MHTPTITSVPRLLRRPAVTERTGLPKSTLYAMMKEGSFPKPRKLSANIVAWSEAEVSAWVAARLQAA
jgi:prophage regulatory protein